MTPLDILILALPADRERAECVLDGLHEAKVAGVLATRIETTDPMALAWAGTARIARESRCVLFCWSRATAAPEAEPMRMLGADLAARDTAISIELDRGATPVALAGSTTYPAYGWRCRPGAVLRFLFGDIHRLQIAVAAQRKVSGQDPPPPAALWQLLRARGWAAVVGLFAVLGLASMLWGLWNDNALARLADPAMAATFADARDRRDCRAMHAFSDDNPGSPWTAEVTEFLANCQMRDVPERHRAVQAVPVFGGTRAEAEANAQGLCERFVANGGDRLALVRLTQFEPGGAAMAECVVEHRLSVPREVYIASP